LANHPNPSPILLPSVMLKHDETRFLDDLTVAEVGDRLGRPIFPVAGIEDLLREAIALIPPPLLPKAKGSQI